MANGRKSFLDLFRMDDDDDNYDEEDDIFDEDDADEYEPAFKPKKQKKQKPVKAQPSAQAETPSYRQPGYAQKQARSYSQPDNRTYQQPGYAAPEKPAPEPRKERRFSRSDNLVSFDSYERKSTVPPSNEVYVIRPMEFDDAQTVADFLKKGRATVINMEGLQIESAQRIIDFIGGACYGLEGELKAISANIFIAVPASMEVSGDLRDEILSQSFGTPTL